MRLRQPFQGKTVGSNRLSKADREIESSTAADVSRVGHAAKADDQAAEANRSDVPQIVATVRTQLTLSITELAAILDVQRPTIYAWLRGDAQPQQRNLDRLGFLNRVAAKWAQLAEYPIGARMREPFAEDGKSLFGLLKEADPRFSTIQAQLVRFAADGPLASKRLSAKELATKHGLSTKPHENAELVIDIETGKRLTND